MQFIQVLEAPFPYLIGAKKSTVINSEINLALNGIVMIDLDNRDVTDHSTIDSLHLPGGLKKKILKEIN